MSNLNFKEKYLMYKVKYLNLKKNPPLRGGRGERNENKNENKDIEILLFKADWCGHCKNFKSTWDKLKSQYENKYKFIEYDADKNNNELVKFNVNSFPTIKFKQGDRITEYQGSRDHASLNETIIHLL
jgi:thioredoxin-like negative regulator of GroEL